MKNRFCLQLLYLSVLTVIFFNSCQEYEFNNPVDSAVGLLPPTDLEVSVFTDTSVTFSFKDPNPVPLDGSIKQLNVIHSENNGPFTLIGISAYHEGVCTVFGNFTLDKNHSFRAYTQYGENRSSAASVSVTKPLPAAPSNMQVNFTSDTLAILTWTDNCSFEKGFEIEKSNDNVAYTSAGFAGANVTSYQVPGDYLLGKTYYFRVKAVTNRNTSQPATASKQLVFNAPSNISATFAADSAVTITWTDNSTIETGFEIEQSTDNTNFTKVGTAAQNATSKTVEGVFLIANTYYFRVRAVTPRNASTYSQIVSKQLVFNAPSNITVAFVADSAVTITWTDNSTIETGFEIEQSTDNTNFTKVGTAEQNATSKTVDGNFLLANTYYFRVRAVTPRNASTYSQIASKQLVFNAPSNVTATFVADSAVTITWTDNSTIETGFEIEQSTNNSVFTKVGTAVQNATNKTVEGVFLLANTYYFRVRAITPRNNSPFSQSVSQQMVFGAPSSVGASFISDTAVTISWIDNSSIETGFEIEQSTDNTSFTKVGTATKNSIIKTIEGIYLLANTYFFRVRAVTPRINSPYSQTLSQQLIFNAPSNTTATFEADSAVTITWTDNSTYEWGFVIEQSTDNISYQMIADAPKNASSKTVDGIFLISNTYYFRVYARTPRNKSPYSEPASQQLVFGAPSNFAINSLSPTQVQLQWRDNSNVESGFEIHCSSDGSNYFLLSLRQANTTTATLSGSFTLGTTYYFKIRAKSRNNGTTAFSNLAQNICFSCGISTVLYSGTAYNTVQIGAQCWLKENLDVGVYVASTNTGSTHSDVTDNGIIEKYCYDNNIANCATYGGLYDWKEAMGYETTAGARGICPPGWHIPTYEQLQALSTAVGGNSNALKRQDQGSGAGQGNNSSGFSALLAGGRYGYGYFGSPSNFAYYWSSSEYSVSFRARFMYLYDGDSGVYFDYYDKEFGFSIRCAKD